MPSRSGQQANPSRQTGRAANSFVAQHLELDAYSRPISWKHGDRCIRYEPRFCFVDSALAPSRAGERRRTAAYDG